MCDVEGVSQVKRVRDSERLRDGMACGCGRSEMTAPTEGVRWCMERSSTMTGRPRRGEAKAGFGDEGAVNVWGYICGGVRGVGGASTIMMRSLRWVRVGILSLCRRSVEEEDGRRCEFESRWMCPGERGGVEGKSGCENIYWVVGSLNWILRTGFSSVEWVGQGRVWVPY